MRPRKNKTFCATAMTINITAELLGVKPPGFNCTYECPDISQYRRYQCDGENEFNPMATLTLVKGNDAIGVSFFHNPAHYHPSVLFGFCAMCFLLSAFAYGSAVLFGSFVPCLLIGGSMGRGIGELVLQWGVDANPAMYALIGASAVLSGVTRHHCNNKRHFVRNDGQGLSYPSNNGCRSLSQNGLTASTSLLRQLH